MKLFLLVSLLTIRIFNLSAIHRWKQLLLTTTIPAFRNLPIYNIDIFTNQIGNGCGVVVIVLVYHAGDSGSIPCWGNIFLVSFFPFFLEILHFVTLQESKAFHLKFYCYYTVFIKTFDPPHDKTNTMACAPSEDSDQPGHLPRLIRVFTVRMKKAWVISYPLNAQRRLWSNWADAQADLSLRWAHMSLCWFCRVVAHL